MGFLATVDIPALVDTQVSVDILGLVDTLAIVVIQGTLVLMQKLLGILVIQVIVVYRIDEYKEFIEALQKAAISGTDAVAITR